MKNDEFEEMVRVFRAKQDELILTKGHDYTIGDEDRLHNFKMVSSMLGISPLQALGVYWLKHVLAICTYIKYGKVESETIEGRLLDESNYNLLAKALIHDCARSIPKVVRGNAGKTGNEKLSAVQKRKVRSRHKRAASKRYTSTKM